MAGRRFQDQVVIVTGGGSGLGEADAKLFAAEGAHVVLADVDAANGERVRKEIGSAASFASLDVRDEEAWRRLVSDVVSAHGRLDVLVNSAGILHLDSPESITGDALRRAWDVNVTGTILGCKHALGAMRKGGRAGAIVNISSITAIRGVPEVTSYSITKGAVAAYTRSLAVHCAQEGLPVRANAVLPAAIDTPMHRQFSNMMDADGIPMSGVQEDTNLSSSIGRADDVAALVVYLASSDARFISGEAIVLDNTQSVTLGNIP